jgi:hypothetical protein
MTDLSLTIAPKSDQLNADDLIAGPRTIRITKVSANPESAEQPVSIFYEGDGGKPYRPCKSMRRVLVHVWGKDGNSYPGRSLTLYRDPDVTFGGLAVGGIRISNMSHIKEPQVMALTATKKSRKPFKVLPLIEKVEPSPVDELPPDPLDALRERVSAVVQLLDKQHTPETVASVERRAAKVLADCDATEGASDLRVRLVEAFAAARERVEPSDAAEPESLEMPA